METQPPSSGSPSLLLSLLSGAVDQQDLGCPALALEHQDCLPPSETQIVNADGGFMMDDHLRNAVISMDVGQSVSGLEFAREP